LQRSLIARSPNRKTTASAFNQSPTALLSRLKRLSGTRLGDRNAVVRNDGNTVSGRVCALKKSKVAAEQAQRKVPRDSSKKGRQTKPETLEAAGYIFV
jgi:hypothetical protein